MFSGHWVYMVIVSHEQVTVYTYTYTYSSHPYGFNHTDDCYTSIY